ncbi:MAG TPA: transcription termination factor Rho, partial [Chryseobacterium indologenes]|nr:transcription termination factor Rho [Chryseobacterium indologenes]
MFNIETLRSKSVTELTKILKDLGVKVARNSNENDKIFAILDFQASNPKVSKDYFNATETTSINTEEAAAEKPAKAPARKAAAPKKTAAKPKTTAKAPVEPKVEEKVEEKIPDSEEVKTEEPKAETALATEETSTPSAAAKKKRKRVSTNTGNTEVAQEKPETPKNTESQESSPIEEKPNHPQQQANNRPQKGHNHPQNGGNQNKNQNQQHQHQNQNQNRHSEKAEEAQDHKKEFNFDGLVSIEGVLEILPDNYGFLRSSDFSYISSPDDVYVSTAQIRNFGLKTGDTVKGIVRLPKEGEKYFSLLRPTEVNGRDLAFIKDRVAFEYLTPLFPEEKFNLAGSGSTVSTRIVDLFAPIGKGQRAMIVAQPKTGKTMLLKDIANSIAANHPEVYMMVLLIDERPE